MKTIRSFSIRIEEELLQKLHHVSLYDGRSANSEILYFIRQGLIAFENEHGKIEISDAIDNDKI